MPRLPLPGFLPAALCTALCTLSLGAQDTRDRRGEPARLAIVPGATGTVPTRETLALEVGPSGELRRGSATLTVDELRQELITFAKKHPAGKLGSRSQLLLRLHAELPYEALYRILELCAAPDVLIYRLFAAVRAEKKGPEVALPIFLPSDKDRKARGQLMSMVLELEYARPPLDAAMLRDRLTSAKTLASKTLASKTRGLGQAAKLAILLKPEMHTPVGTVLRVVQSARKGGFDDLRFGRGGAFGFPAWSDGTRDLARVVASAKAPPVSDPGVSISGPKSLSDIQWADAQKGKTFNTAVNFDNKTTGKYGNRRRPPTGKDVASAVAIDLALGWLAKHQDDDGRWDTDGFMKHDTRTIATDGPGNRVHDVGITGLALLAFLGDGSTLRTGPYKDVVKKGVKWLRMQQGPNGLFGTNASHDFLYDHAIATAAMCEAYGLSQYKTLRKNAQAGINYLESHRNPYALWRYQPRDNDNDVSISSWCLLAYKAASDFKLDTNPNVFKIGLSYLDQLTDPASGRSGYTRRGERSSRHPGGHATQFPIDKGEALTAAALFLRFILGQDPEKIPVMKVAADTIVATPPSWKLDGSIDFYYWYYGSYAMYQMGGKHWKTWQAALTKALLKSQRRDANFAGSWDPVGVWCQDGGRVYSTAMAALSLEAVFRYSRLLRKENK